MSDASKNFTLRLSPDDHQRLEQLAERLEVDRTGALRLLIRRAVPALSTEGDAVFTAVSHQHLPGTSMFIRLRLGGKLR